jgi:hypothetical protein
MKYLIKFHVTLFRVKVWQFRKRKKVFEKFMLENGKIMESVSRD